MCAEETKSLMLFSTSMSETFYQVSARYRTQMQMSR